MATTHGRCRPCDLLYTWRGKPLLREALCAECRRPLDRTAAGLLKGVLPALPYAPLMTGLRCASKSPTTRARTECERGNEPHTFNGGGRCTKCSAYR